MSIKNAFIVLLRTKILVKPVNILMVISKDCEIICYVCTIRI